MCLCVCVSVCLSVCLSVLHLNGTLSQFRRSSAVLSRGTEVRATMCSAHRHRGIICAVRAYVCVCVVYVCVCVCVFF